MSNAERIEESQSAMVSPGTARTLAKYGITVINSANETILRRGATVVAKISKTGARFLGPAISFLDEAAANGLLRMQSRVNVDRFYEDTGNLDVQIQLLRHLSADEHIMIVIILSAHDYPYRNIKQLLVK